MSDTQDEILLEFKEESKALLAELDKILNKVDGDFSQVQSLEEYGQTVDRIMGGAKSLALSFPPDHFIHKVGDYAALCKAVGYKASQNLTNETLFDICVAVLEDATEILQKMIAALGTSQKVVVNEMISKTFLDRLKWVSDQFGEDVRASVSAKGKKMSQTEIDDLMKKLGIG